MATDDRLDLAVSLDRDDGGGTSGLQFGEDEVGTVILFGEQNGRHRPRLVHDSAVALQIRDLPAAQRDRDREAKWSLVAGWRGISDAASEWLARDQD